MTETNSTDWPIPPQHRYALTAERIEKTAYEWQVELYNQWLADGRVLADVATGLGKSRGAMYCAAGWRVMHGENAKVLILVPTKKLVLQWRNHCVVQRFPVASISSDFKTDHLLNKFAYVSTYQSLGKVKANPFISDPNTKLLIICDEAQYVGAERTAEMFEDFQGDSCLLLSATPKRGDAVDIRHIMNTKSTYKLGLIDGRVKTLGKEAALNFTFHYVMVKASEAEEMEILDLIKERTTLRKRCEKLLHDSGNGNPYDIFDRINTNKDEVGAEIAKTVAVYKHKCMEVKRAENEVSQRYDISRALMRNRLGKKDMYLHESILGIERLNQLCRDEGLNPRVYHSGIKLTPAIMSVYPELATEDFARRLKEYNNNASSEFNAWAESATDTLLSCKSLKEGVDIPNTDGIIMLTGANEVGKRIQTIGRVFRGNKHKDIYMFILNLPTEYGSGDERCFYNVMKETGIPYDNVRITNLALLEAGAEGIPWNNNDNDTADEPVDDDFPQPVAEDDDFPLPEETTEMKT